jgi:hypothetical protein
VADLEPGGRPLGDDACGSIVFTLIDDDQLSGEKLAGQDRVETTSEPLRAVERGHGDADLIRLFLPYFLLQQGLPLRRTRASVANIVEGDVDAGSVPS